MTVNIIPPPGGYQELLSFQKAQIVYDATVKFCADLLDKRDRMSRARQAVREGM